MISNVLKFNFSQSDDGKGEFLKVNKGYFMV